MFDYLNNPRAIEKLSMEKVDRLIEGQVTEKEYLPLVKRMVHATGDAAYAELFSHHPGAYRASIELLQKGVALYTDVKMVKCGINQKILGELGGSLHCLLEDGRAVEEAARRETTRASAAVELQADKLGEDSVVVIGNAPTALFTLLEMMAKGVSHPGLIIATPVGFVGAAESKEELCKLQHIPWFTVRGTRGGSPAAVALANALLLEASRLKI